MKTDLCDKYWWTNLLYINNFYPKNANDQCLGWGWYLADGILHLFLYFVIIAAWVRHSDFSIISLFYFFVCYILIFCFCGDEFHSRARNYLKKDKISLTFQDMQYFIFAPLIILLFRKSRSAALMVLVFLYVGCIVLVGVLTHHYHLRPLDPGDANWNTIVYSKVSSPGIREEKRREEERRGEKRREEES